MPSVQQSSSGGGCCGLLTGFNNVGGIVVSPSYLFKYSAIAIQFAHTGNYSQALEVLQYTLENSGNTSNLQEREQGNAHNSQGQSGQSGNPSHASDYLAAYLISLSGTILTLKSIDTELIQLQNFTNSGDTIPAQQKALEIGKLIEDASYNITVAGSALNTLRDKYQIDVSTQRELILTLVSRLQGDELALAELKSIVSTLDLQTATELNITVTPVPVLIEDRLHISAQIRSKGVELPNRTVQIWINNVEVANVTSDSNGTAGLNYLASDASHYDNLVIYARYVPSGSDTLNLRPTRSMIVTVPVEYYPVNLTVETDVSNVRVQQNFTVRGTLTNSSRIGLPDRTLQLLVDGIQTGTAKTDQAGDYTIVSSIQPENFEGSHALNVSFAPASGIYESTSSNSSIEAYYLHPNLELFQNQSIVVSGQEFVLQGTAMIGTKPVSDGLIVALIGQNELGRALTDSGGHFRLAINVPLEATGQTPVRITYVPDEPWIKDGSTYLVLNVWNSSMIAIGLSTFGLAGIAVATKPPRELSVTETTESEEEITNDKTRRIPTIWLNRPSLLDLRFLEGISEPDLRLVEAYWSSRAIIGIALNDPGRLSESVREYAVRAAGKLGKGAAWFSTLTHLFEVAEYGNHPASNDDAQRAVDNAVRIADLVAPMLHMNAEADQ